MLYENVGYGCRHVSLISDGLACKADWTDLFGTLARRDGGGVGVRVTLFTSHALVSVLRLGFSFLPLSILAKAPFNHMNPQTWRHQIHTVADIHAPDEWHWLGSALTSGTRCHTPTLLDRFVNCHSFSSVWPFPEFLLLFLPLLVPFTSRLLLSLLRLTSIINRQCRQRSHSVCLTVEKPS